MLMIFELSSKTDIKAGLQLSTIIKFDLYVY